MRSAFRLPRIGIGRGFGVCTRRVVLTVPDSRLAYGSGRGILTLRSFAQLRRRFHSVFAMLQLNALNHPIKVALALLPRSVQVPLETCNFVSFTALSGNRHLFAARPSE